YFFFGAHYRVQQNFTWEALEASQNALHKLQKIVKGLPKGADVNEEYKSRFMERINDDLDVPGALSVLWTMIKDDDVAPELKYATLIKFDEVLGLGFSNLELGDVEVPEEVHELLDLRAKARAEKNWELSDQIRDKILELGFEISDGQGGQTIEPIV
ncbi:MAG: cysteine--tRNA ligase, partial [Patescibacteria group bacterium]